MQEDYCYRGNEIPGCEGEPGAAITATYAGRAIRKKNEDSQEDLNEDFDGLDVSTV